MLHQEIVVLMLIAYIHNKLLVTNIKGSNTTSVTVFSSNVNKLRYATT